MQRLKTRAQFQAVLGGKLVAKTEHFALHCVELGTATVATAASVPVPVFTRDATWFGAMAPKRWAKRAVTRNAIKRQIYSVGTLLKPILPNAAFLVRLRREFSRKDFISASSTELKEAVRSEVLELMKKVHPAHAQGAISA